MTRVESPRPASGFIHEALCYRGSAEFLVGTLAFIRAGLAAGDPVLVAVPEPRLGRLRDELADERDRVRFVDMAEDGRNPNRILPWILLAFARAQKGRRVRIVGEPIFVGRTSDEITAGVVHEALINVAFAGMDAEIMCPYDVGQLPGMIADVERTHPVIVTGGGGGGASGHGGRGERHRSAAYTDPFTVAATLNRPLREPDRVDETLEFAAAGLAAVRRLVGKHAQEAGLTEDRVAELQLAVSEIGTNALTHAGPSVATLRVWSDEDKIVCEVSGSGEIADIMAGRTPPDSDSPHGRGLLIANQLCDLVQTYTSPTGTVTRLHMLRPRSPGLSPS